MPLAAFQENWLLWMTPEWGSKSDPKIGFADRASPVLSADPQGSERAAAGLADCVVAIKHRKDNFRDVRSEVIMRLNDRRSQGI